MAGQSRTPPTGCRLTRKVGAPAIELVDVAKTYHAHGEDVHAVRNMNLAIGEGEFFSARAVGVRQDHDDAHDRRLEDPRRARSSCTAMTSPAWRRTSAT